MPDEPRSGQSLREVRRPSSLKNSHFQSERERARLLAPVLRHSAPTLDGRALASILDRNRRAHVVAYSNPNVLGLPIEANFVGFALNRDCTFQFPIAHLFLFSHSGGRVLRAGRQGAARAEDLPHI